MKLRLEARVSSDSPDAVGRFLVGKFGARSVWRERKGLEHRIRNAAYGQLYRGFESLPLRHTNKINDLDEVVSDISDSN